MKVQNTEIDYAHGLLSIDQIKNPFLVIEDFFDQSPLIEIRLTCWNMFEYALSSDLADNLPAPRRADLVAAYGNISKLIEAAFVIFQWDLHQKIDRMQPLIQKPYAPVV